MKTITYNKLVRDKIPEIIAKDKKSCICETLSEGKYLEMLDSKLTEECKEYQESKTIEELADILEVIHAITKARGYSLEELENLRKEKAEKRGAFEKRIFLKEVRESEEEFSEYNVVSEENLSYEDLPLNQQEEQLIKKHKQKLAKGMLSQQEFVKMVDVQYETVYKYVKENKIIPDLSIPIGEKRSFNYYKEITIQNYAQQFDWGIITEFNIKEKFIEFVEKMDMSYSYKPVLLKGILENMNEKGEISIESLVSYFIEYYENRKAEGLIAEKPTSIYQKGGYTEKDVERNILSNPYKRFADMRFLKRSKNITQVQLNKAILKQLTKEDRKWIENVCDKKLEEYYEKVDKQLK